MVCQIRRAATSRLHRSAGIANSLIPKGEPQEDPHEASGVDIAVNIFHALSVSIHDLEAGIASVPPLAPVLKFEVDEKHRPDPDDGDHTHEKQPKTRDRVVYTFNVVRRRLPQAA